MNNNLFRRVKDIFLAFDIIEKTIFIIILGIAYIAAVIVIDKLNDKYTIEKAANGGSFTEGIVGYPRFINPVLAYTDADKDMTSLLYAGLFKAGKDNTLIPELLESFSLSSDGLVYIFKLKPNLTFHDGSPLTADDVLYTIETAKNPEIMSRGYEKWQDVQAEILNPLEIKITLKKQFPSFLENMTIGILPKHIWKNVESGAFDISAYNREPIGSGPYKLKSATRDSSGIYKEYTLESFNKYSLGKPHITNIHIKFFKNEDEAVVAYTDGDIDTLGGVTAYNASKLVNELDRNEFHQINLPRIFSVYLNPNTASIFANKDVRNALNVGTNKDEIINKVFYGFASKAKGPLPDFESATTTYQDKIQEAREILTKAGWKPNANGIMTRQNKVGNKVENQVLSFILTTTNNEQLKNTAEILKSAWEKMGAEVNIEVYEPSDLSQKILKARKYEALLYGNVIGRDNNLYLFWHSSERLSPGLNIASYANIEVDKLLEKAEKEEDMETRKSIYKEAETIITNENPAIFLYSPDYIYLVSSKIKNIDLKKINETNERFNNIENWFINSSRTWKLTK